MTSPFFVARSPSDLPQDLTRSVVVLGNLDGVHRGHQALFQVARERALQCPLIVLTFDPHPTEVIGGRDVFQRIFPLAVQNELFRQAGAQGVFYQNFNMEFARVSALEFLENFLFPLLRPQGIVVGFNFRFGHRREGTPDFLKAWGETRGISVDVVPAFQWNGETVSSSRIRRALQEGAVDEARSLLGFPFFMQGKVVTGARRGQQIGFPTANLDFVERGLDVSLVPAFGVYATRTFWAEGPPAGQISVSHLGPLPTFADDRPRLETHLLDFQGDLYGASLRVEFYRRLREPLRFSGPSDLRKQISHDIEQARKVHDELISTTPL